ncbi:MAG: SUMF1/EgtB/PvdO family nonheme iron enzyme [Planctomycetaceae bacterium]|jgi:formylglycine-generating enzyme required for sulfatase activity|nr:SUMF1/EgtB/PvdO family nonheme iron enzyme [Planctomycetaceae bacterium]
MTDENKPPAPDNIEGLDDLDIFGIADDKAVSVPPASAPSGLIPQQSAGNESGIIVSRTPTPSSLIQPEKEFYYQPRSDGSGVIDSATLLKLTDGVTLSKRFILGKIISQSETWENRFASDIHTGATVTVHIPLEAVQHNPQQITELRQGYALIAKLQHPHIAPMVGIFDDVNFGLFIVRSYVTGKTFNEYRRDYVKTNGSFPVLQAVQLLADAASALDYANGHGVIHRDLTPSNIIVSPDQGVQVANFLLPFELVQSGQYDPDSVYVSSEEKWDGYANAKSNQYVLAVIAYELITGHRGATTADMDFMPVPLPEIPPYIVNVIRRATAKQQDERYENCQAFIKALDSGQQKSAVAVQTGEKTPKKKTLLSSPAFLITLAALLLAAATGAAYWMSLNHVAAPQVPQTVAPQPVPESKPAPPVEKKTVETVKKEPEAEEEEEKGEEPVDEKKSEAGVLPKKTVLPTAAKPVKPNTPKPEAAAAKTDKAANPEDTVKELSPAELAKQKREKAAALTRKDFQDHPDHQPDKGQIDTLKITVGTVPVVFCWIPPCPEGFMMGSPATEAGHLPDELQHRVILSRGFYLLETEVTQNLWQAVMQNNPSNSFGSPNLPVENISWDDCQQFIAAINKKNLAPPGYHFSLPLEAQWEYACRSGKSTPFSFGFALNGDNANCDGMEPYDALADDQRGLPGQNVSKSQRAKSYPPNPWGLYDMHGNVWEWCLDWHGDYPAGTIEDPTGPAVGIYRVRRGGCWGRAAVYCRSSSRGVDIPDTHQNRVGFRLALVPADN